MRDGGLNARLRMAEFSGQGGRNAPRSPAWKGDVTVKKFLVLGLFGWALMMALPAPSHADLRIRVIEVLPTDGDPEHPDRTSPIRHSPVVGGDEHRDSRVPSTSGWSARLLSLYFHLLYSVGM
jgi:hypothetical protein